MGTYTSQHTCACWQSSSFRSVGGNDHVT